MINWYNIIAYAIIGAVLGEAGIQPTGDRWYFFFIVIAATVFIDANSSRKNETISS